MSSPQYGIPCSFLDPMDVKPPLYGNVSSHSKSKPDAPHSLKSGMSCKDKVLFLF